jgi:hypothetical protein
VNAPTQPALSENDALDGSAARFVLVRSLGTRQVAREPGALERIEHRFANRFVEGRAEVGRGEPALVAAVVEAVPHKLSSPRPRAMFYAPVMGFRFRRSVRLFPGVRANVSASGVSLSVGGRGATLNLSSRGARATFGIRGTGLSYSAPLFRPQSESRGQTIHTAPIRTTTELVDAVHDPRATVVYRGSGRRLSAQQLTAAYRQLAQQEARARGQAEIDRIEAELRDVIDAWKDMPPVPTPAEYERALQPQPFAFAEERPRKPDFASAEASFVQRLREEVTRVRPRSMLERAAGAAAGVLIGLAVGAILWTVSSHALVAATAGIFVGGIVALVVARSRSARWHAKITKEVDERARIEWPPLQDRLAREHDRAVVAFEERRSSAEAEWSRTEEQRVAWAKRLVSGELEAIEDTIAETLADLDFPFDTRCAVGIEHPESAFVALDLPEIEDVIPETRYQVLKSGQLKEVKRKPDERNAAYARLVSGLAFTIAASAFAAAPTLDAVLISAYTQRKRRGATTTEDQYVYEARIRRGVFATGMTEGDPIELLLAQETRLDWGGKGELKKIDPPAWSTELLEEGLDESAMAGSGE